MHMSPGPSQAPIVACQPEALATELWRILAPQSWPLPLEALPRNTVLVGGAVRDALLGRLAQRPDLDLVVEGDAVELARTLARRLGGALVVLDRERSMARLVLQGWTIDLARRMGADLPQDLLRRDYSANAIALPLPGSEPTGALVDPSGGLADLAAGRLRAISEANLLEDPLRLLRGVRLASELNFELDSTSLGWIRRHHARLREVAGERVLAELERLAAAPQGAGGLELAVACGLLECWGGASAQDDRKESPAPAIRTALASLSAADGSSWGLNPEDMALALPLARLAAVLDGEALERLRASRKRQQSVRRLRHWWERLKGPEGDPSTLPEPEQLLLYRQLEADLPALALLLAPAWARQALARWRNPHDPLFHPRPLIDGAALQSSLKLKPGPELGELLEHLTLERAFGRLPAAAADDDGETLTEARRWISSRGDPRHG
jgi:tRNA nucleotidyltransferase (CCA-adding enzyme)